METWHPSLETFFIGYRFWWGEEKQTQFPYVVNVNKKEQVKQIHMFCFEEAFLHSHGSKILSDFMTIHIRFSIEVMKNEVKLS